MTHHHPTPVAPSAMCSAITTLMARGFSYDEALRVLWPRENAATCDSCREEQAGWIPEAWGYRRGGKAGAYGRRAA